VLVEAQLFSMLKRVVYIVTTEHCAERSDFAYRNQMQSTCIEHPNVSASGFKVTAAALLVFNKTAFKKPKIVLQVGYLEVQQSLSV
jgi:hypothetical protein